MGGRTPPTRPRRNVGAVGVASVFTYRVRRPAQRSSACASSRRVLYDESVHTMYQSVCVHRDGHRHPICVKNRNRRPPSRDGQAQCSSRSRAAPCTSKRPGGWRTHRVRSAAFDARHHFTGAPLALTVVTTIVSLFASSSALQFWHLNDTSFGGGDVFGPTIPSACTPNKSPK